jgi:class III poly(R)-hydroxyalkanoic acid synthase PhaE subunit
MASSTNNESEQWFNDWTKVQKDYWQWWADMAGKAPSSAPPGTEGLAGFGAWSEALQQWQNMFLGKPRDPVKDMFDRTNDMAKQYMDMAERFYRSSDDSAGGQDMVDNWLGSLEDSFKHWQKQLESGLDVDMPDIFGLGKSTVKEWQHMAEKMLSSAQVPEISLDQIPGYTLGRDQFMRALAAPAMGLSRERQEQLQLLSERMLEYFEALRAYKLAFAKNGLRSLEALAVRFNEMNHSEEEIKSLRALYDIWVEVNEDSFDKFAMSDEYQVVYGDMVNSLMAVRKEMNKLAEDNYRAMNLPTRSDLDAVAQRALQAQRENRALKRELKRLGNQVELLQQNASAGSRPTSKSRAAAKPKQQAQDDLTRIKGIGPKMQERLHEEGIKTFKQLAALNKNAVSSLEENMKLVGRITREKWVQQAETLLNDN